MAATLPVVAPLLHRPNAGWTVADLAAESAPTSAPANASPATVLTAARSAGTTRSASVPFTDPARPGVVAVMVVVPTVRAVASPAELTVTTLGLDDAHVNVAP